MAVFLNSTREPLPVVSSSLRNIYPSYIMKVSSKLSPKRKRSKNFRIRGLISAEKVEFYTFRISRVYFSFSNLKVFSKLFLKRKYSEVGISSLCWNSRFFGLSSRPKVKFSSLLLRISPQ